jgi:hypothetical protein
MLTPNLVLNTGLTEDTAVSTFALQAYLPDGSRRMDVQSTLNEPRLLEIKHSTTGKGASIVDRHLISASLTQNNSLTPGPQKATVNLTLSVPRSAAFSPSLILGLLRSILDVCYDGESTFIDAEPAFITAIMRGES